MMLCMDKLEIWAELYERLKQLSESPGWNQTRIAREAGLSVNTVNSFMLEEGKRGMYRGTYSKLKRVADKYGADEAQTRHLSGDSGRPDLKEVESSRDHLIPVVDLDQFSFDPEDPAMDKRLEDEAVFFVPVPGARRGKDFLVRINAVMRLRKGTGLPGDLFLIERGREPKKGGVALVPIRRRGHLADIEEVAGELVAVLPSGERISPIKSVGTVRYRLEDWS